MKQFFFLILMIGLSYNVSAQDRAPSPLAKIEQRVGLTDITLEYSRPGLKGRTAFTADSPLAPLGKIWRTGANSATKITFSDDVKLNGQDVAAGSYALLTTPGAGSWTISLYTHTSTRWSTYRDAEPTVSFTTESSSMGTESIETLMIEFDNIKDYSAMMWIGWSTTFVPISLEVK